MFTTANRHHNNIKLKLHSAEKYIVGVAATLIFPALGHAFYFRQPPHFIFSALAHALGLRQNLQGKGQKNNGRLVPEKKDGQPEKNKNNAGQ